jgi:Zn-dependent protease
VGLVSLDFSAESIQRAITFLIALILSICVHEFGHAFVADRLGDGLPRSQGRVTLNPLAHIDPIGTILMPLVITFAPGAPLLGWGRPVQTNPIAYTRRLRMKHGHMLVAAAGPAMNLVLAVIVTLILFTYRKVGGDHLNLRVALNLRLLVTLNLGLMFFNLLPLPPLDGGAVLRGLLPDSAAPVFDNLQRYGGIILLALLASRMLGTLMLPAARVIEYWLQLWGFA